MRVQESFVDLSTPTGVMRTYIYEPAAPALHQTKKWAGLLLYSEIFQQTAPIKRLALQFCSQGYIVAVPEIYHEHELPGNVLSYDERGRDKGNEYKIKTKLSSFDATATTAVEFLLKHASCNGRIGSVGFCIGGHLSFRAALHPKVLSSACFYPTDLHTATLCGGDDSLQRAGDIKGELLLIFGKEDPHVPVEGRAYIYQTLQDKKVNFTCHEFHAQHAFMRDEGERYDPALARLSFSLAMEFFSRTL